MPVNIMVGLFALLVPLLAYTHAVWGAFRKKGPTKKHLIVLWVGLAFDVLATAMMAMQIGGLDLRPGAPMAHTALALVAMFGMAAIAGVGTWALAQPQPKLQLALSRLAVAPWAVWMFVFVWAMIDRGGARIAGS